MITLISHGGINSNAVAKPGKQKCADHHGTVRAEILEHSKQGFHKRRIFTAGSLNNGNRIVLPVLTKLGELRERRHIGHPIQK